MNFKVNDFTTINNFVRLGIFETFTKFGSPYEYEKFEGEIEGQKVNGFICLADDNIYKLSKLE